MTLPPILCDGSFKIPASRLFILPIIVLFRNWWKLQLPKMHKPSPDQEAIIEHLMGSGMELVEKLIVDKGKRAKEKKGR